MFSYQRPNTRVQRNPLGGRALVVIALAFSTAAPTACTRRPAGFELGQLPAADVAEYQRQIKTAEVVLVGRLIAVDTEWTGYSGVLAICATASFRVETVLKGTMRENELTVENYMVGKSLWVEERSSHSGLRLASAFFVRGAEYIVLVDKRYQFCGKPSIAFICVRSEANLKRVRADLAAA